MATFDGSGGGWLARGLCVVAGVGVGVETGHGDDGDGAYSDNEGVDYGFEVG